MDTTDSEAAKMLDRLREHLPRVRQTATQAPWTPGPGEFGREDWTAIAARNALQPLNCLRGWGADWLDRQPKAVQQEVDEAERELLALRAQAIVGGAVDLPNELPADPFG